MTQPIYPCLWFDGKSKQAAEFYCTVFENTSIKDENPMVVTFDLDGQRFMCLNGGPMFKPNPSISFFVTYQNEAELDVVWNKLAEGGKVMMALDKYPWSSRYGWLTDKFGISWQLYLGDVSDVPQKVCSCFMFTKNVAGKAKEAINFYTSLFENSSVGGIMKYGPDGQDNPEYVAHAQFLLNGETFMSMDSSMSHDFTFDEGISLVVTCKDQEEIDYFWNKMTADGGQESQCGWLKDKYGVSWQIVPAVLQQLMSDPERSKRVVPAFMKMKKFIIQDLLDA
ncbi:VOC family protein [Taibaiella lutea]|uniref:VOC family protein n=1 Tax=Taibaiella lutea TaxID=2608001 RepID=A0A5M6CPM0_9BACT|nr:VOC family protein [Taibaiella lutea]KAA5537104.1 VOC family protein [Taibaiella lutea]